MSALTLHEEAIEIASKAYESTAVKNAVTYSWGEVGCPGARLERVELFLREGSCLDRIGVAEMAAPP